MPATITLSQGVPEWFVDQFSGTLYHVCQQKESKFAQAVRVEPILDAEDKAFDMMDKLDLVQKEGRNPATPTTTVSTQRRWVTTDPWHQGVQFDQDDDLSMIVDPRSDVITGLQRAVNRTKDDIILAAFDATVYSGRRRGSTISWASQNGTTKYTTAAATLTTGGRTIPHDCSEGNCSSSDTGMTVEKIELIKEYFAFKDIDEDTPIWCAISPGQATDLFGQEEYVNRDYGGADSLATGYIRRNFHGINWVVSNKITKGSSNDVDGTTDVYRCWAWAQDGIILGVQKDVSVRMAVRHDLSDSQEVYVHMNMGAMRMDEDRVCLVECQ